MKRVIFLVVVVGNFLYGFCDYHDCTPEVVRNTQQLKNNINSAFREVQNERKTLSNNYDKFNAKLEKNNELYIKLIKLNANINLTLQEIKKAQQQTNTIKVIDNE